MRKYLKIYFYSTFFKISGDYDGLKKSYGFHPFLLKHFIFGMIENFFNLRYTIKIISTLLTIVTF